MSNIITVDTENLDSIIDSIGDLFGINRDEIHYYIISNHIKHSSGNYEDIDILDFYDFIKENKKDKNHSIQPNFYVTSFHLAKRLSPINSKDPLYNLHNSLINETEMRKFFESMGITFYKEGKKLFCLYQNRKVNWLEIRDDATTRLIISRLEGSNITEVDKCVNGILFGDDIVKETNISHLTIAPEIVQNILHVLNKDDFIKQFQTKYLYKIKFRLKFSNFIFEGIPVESNKEKFDTLIKILLHYSSFALTGNQSYSSNILVRNNDEYDIESSDILTIKLLN